MNVNARDVYRETPLHYASSHGHVDIVNLLLKKGADINARAKNGSTAVIYAATNGKENVVKELLKAKAVVTLQNIFNDLPIRSIIKSLIKRWCEIQSLTN